MMKHIVACLVWLVHLFLASCLFVNVRGSYHCYDHVFRCTPQTAAVFPLCPGRPDMYMWLSAPYAKARVLSFASVRLQPRQLGYLQSLQTSASRSALLCGVTLDVRNVVGFPAVDAACANILSVLLFPLLAGDAELVQRKPFLADETYYLLSFVARWDVHWVAVEADGSVNPVSCSQGI